MAEISGSCQMGECQLEAEFLIIETVRAYPNMGFPAVERKRKACRDCWRSMMVLQVDNWLEQQGETPCSGS